MSTIFDKPLAGYRFVEIQQGDTLQSIAARELNDAGRWSELIAYNNLVPPYITDDPSLVSEKVRRYGQQLLVPAPLPVISTVTDPDLVFEVDIALKKGMLGVVNGDFELVSGRANLRQAIKHRLETDRGELVYHGDYGSFVRKLIGAVNGPTAALLAAQYASSAVRADERISSVTKATADVRGDVIDVRIEAEPVAGRPIQLNTLL